MNVALFDDSVSNAFATYDPSSLTKLYVGLQFYLTSAQQAAWGSGSSGIEMEGSGSSDEGLFTNGFDLEGNGTFFASSVITPDAWHQIEMCWDMTSASVPLAYDGITDSDTYGPVVAETIQHLFIGMAGPTPASGLGLYIGHVWIGTDAGLHDILLEDWSSGDFSNWTSTTGACSIVSPPATVPAFTPVLGAGPTTPAGRVLIAFDDGPNEPSPTWTAIDQAGDFPDQFVTGYDTRSGKQTLLSQTETGEATVYINDHDLGLFDPRNMSSPYFGKLDGKQILLQLYNPVTAAWESQFQGWITNMTWDIDAATDAQGVPINASIQIECVDVFGRLDGFGLTPGLAGDAPPSGQEDGVYYANAHADDRMIQILTDANVDSSRYGSPSLASMNVRCREVKYDPDESALAALRDAGDAEIPFIANIYVDRFGKFQARGRYGRFAPDSVAAEPGSDWDFTRWAVGDGVAIQADPTRAQMRVLSFTQGKDDVINVAICYPQGIQTADVIDQVYADTTSINDYDKHDAPPMTDLLTADDGLESGSANAKVECFKFAKLTVLNQKDPRVAISALQLKTVRPTDDRAEATWAVLTRSDISHIVNVAVGYPGGSGFAGDSPDDDYYIEGRTLRVRPLDPGYDYVELDLDISPAVWSMDTHGVFPPFS